MGISVVMLAYKEADNLKILLPEIIQQVSSCDRDFEILVIDSEKPLDNTKDVCQQFDARYINQEGPSFGNAYRTGIKYASKDIFLILDADGSHQPKYIPAMYQKMTRDNCDVVIGSRYVEGGQTNDSISSQIMSKLLNVTYRLFLGIKAKDISTDFRMYKTSQLKKLELSCNNFDIVEEILLKLKLNKKNLKIEEVPISFSKRMYGSSKRQLMKYIMSFIKTLFVLTGIRITSSFR